MSTTQNQVTNALTEAIKTIADSSVQSKDATLTIEAEIVDIIDEGLGTYIVKYLGNKFEATTANTEITYQIGDMVYVVVPNGNFDKNKIILSPVNPSSAVYATTQGGISYVTLGDNLFKNIDNISLCTYKPHSADDPSAIVNIDTTGFAALFKAALSDSRTFNLTCKIQTNIEKERRSKGNYGFILDIPVIQTIDGIDVQKYYSIVVDVNNITGDPYDLEVLSLQNFYFSLPEDMVYNDIANPQIRSFVYDFIGEDNTKPDDIFITDIQLLSTLEVTEEQMSGYYSIIIASGGNSFLTSRTGDTKTLSINAYRNGKVTKVSNFDCYWFKENVTINTNSDKFQKFGGIGWEILNKVSEKSIAEDGKITYQYVTNIYTYNITQEEIHCDTKFKCVLVKNDTVINSIITIKNLASDAVIELTSINGSVIYSAGTGNAELQLKYFESGITDVAEPDFIVGYSWQRLDKKGNYIDNDFYIVDEFNRKENNTYYTKIHYPVSEIDERNTISCTVYIDTSIDDDNLVKRQIIGTTQLTLTIGESSPGHIVVTNGDKLYKYDADGDSPMVADYDGPLTSAIKAIEPINITIFKEDGTELTSDEYKVVDVHWLVPIDSMIKLSSSQKTDTETNPGYYTIKGKYPINYSLSYNISNTYNKNKLDNTIIVKAFAPSSVLKETISNVANIRFLKDGEGGTNGSKYSAILTYQGYGYGEKDANGRVHKLQLIYAADVEVWYLFNPAMPGIYNSFTPAELVPVLYADGDNVAFTPNATWSVFDSNYNYSTDKIVSPVSVSNGIISLNGNNWTDTTKNFCVTIEAKVRASRTSTVSSLTSSEEYVYAYYPIECSYITKYEYLKSFMPTLEGGFSRVLYAADGTNPQYDNSENFYVVDSSYNEDISDLYNYSWSTSSNMKVINNNTEPTCKITPTSKYDNGVAKNFVRVDIARDIEKTGIIENKRNELNIQKIQTENLLNYYEILQNNVDIFEDFSYNNYISRITEAAPLYTVKTNLVKTVKQLLSQSEILYGLCNKYKQNDNGSIDNKVLEIYNQVLEKRTSLNNLEKLCNKLGTTSNIINQILAVTPSILAIANKISYSTDGLPSRNCYFTINDNIDLYNNTVNTIYATYLASLNDEQIIAYDVIIRAVISEIQSFVTNTKLSNLTKTYSDCNEEAYRYKALVKTLKARINSASMRTNTYSYNLFIENVLNPMYDSLSWYIAFYNNGGYSDLITQLSEQVNNLSERINVLDNMLLPEDTVNVIHVKPIIMVYNRYELSHINGWDGNKLETGDGYLIAPQVGAGKKNNLNQFTGIVIGVKQVQEKSTSGQKIGMFGYCEGAQSMFLNAEDGSALFGKSGKGQIIIDPSNDAGLLYSGNFWKNYGDDGKPTSYTTSNYNKQGMLIDLTAPEIRFGNGNFVVDESGHVTAAGGGSIAGWNIDDTTISSKISVASGRMVIDSGATVTGTNAKGEKIYTASSPGKIYTGNHNVLTSTSKGFYLSQDGLSICNEMRSRIELSTSGDPKIYSNSKDSLYSRNDGFYLGNDGLRIGEYFIVYDDGRLEASDVDLSGEINANSGTIGNWTISSDGGLYCNNGSTYIGTSGIEIGDNFSVDSSGYLRADYLRASDAELYGNIYADGGRIGNWNISNGNLSCSNLTLDADDSTLYGTDGYIKFFNEGIRIDTARLVMYTSDLYVGQPLEKGLDYRISFRDLDNRTIYLRWSNGILVEKDVN